MTRDGLKCFGGLTEAQREQSAIGPKFKDLDPLKVYGPHSDVRLSMHVWNTNPARYLELKQEALYLLGQEQRPVTDFE